MGDSSIPAFAVPLAKGYGFKRGTNIVGTPVAGGIFRVNLDYSLEAIEVSVVFAFTNILKAAFFDWYDNTINHGANSFNIELESDTGGLETHQALFKPGAMSIRTTEGLNWRVTAILVVETTPSQLQPYGGNLYPLVEELGEQTEAVLDRLALLVNTDFLVLQ